MMYTTVTAQDQDELQNHVVPKLLKPLLEKPCVRSVAHDLVRVESPSAFSMETWKYEPLPFFKLGIDTTTNEVVSCVDTGAVEMREPLRKRIVSGRPVEHAVYYRLKRYGVVCELLEMVVDGDQDKKEADIRIRTAQPDANGKYHWYSFEVKPWKKAQESYTNDASSFPSSIFVDNADEYDEKVKTCERKGELLKGTIRMHTGSGGVLVIPHSTRANWNKRRIKTNINDKQVYVAKRDDFKTIKELLSALGYDGSQPVDDPLVERETRIGTWAMAVSICGSEPSYEKRLGMLKELGIQTPQDIWTQYEQVRNTNND